jgi:hypothetical protein
MAIKLSGSITRKVPITGIEYSSQSFGGALEIELTTDDPAEIRRKLHELYVSLSSAIDNEIAEAQANTGAPAATPPRTLPARAASATTAPAPAANGYLRRNGSGNGHSRVTQATAAQQRAIFAICRNMNIDPAQVLAEFNVADVAQLNVRDASRVIDDLKARQNSH